MLRFYFYLTFVLMLAAGGLSAQKTAVFKKNGEKAFVLEQWSRSLDLLEQYQAAKPGDPGVLTKIGICHYQLHQADKAREYLDYVAAKFPQQADPSLFYYRARTLHGQMHFAEAADAYKQFLRKAGANNPLRANARENIRRCLSGMEISANDAVALVENFGAGINSAGDEFAPLASPNYPDRLYYAAARADARGGLRNDDGYEDEEAGHFCSDIYFTEHRKSGWEPGGDLGSLINTSRFDVALAFSSNGQILYYFRGFTLYAGEIFADTATVKDEYALEPAGFNGPVNGLQGDGSMFFFNDGILLFASRREGGYGGLDLYLSRLVDSMWTEPQNLGPGINSAYDETTPFLARDGRSLYFSSNRPESMGGLDVFHTVFDDETLSWQPVENFGTPVNSPGDDAYFRLNEEGTMAYFSSDRLESLGMRDLYMAYFKSNLPEQMGTRTPLFFADVRPKAPEQQSAKFGFSALYYTDDKDVLSAENQTKISDVVAVARQYPQVQWIVTAHTDETGPTKFDRYYGIKRAEMVGKALVRQGIPADRISLRSAGPNYPAARLVVGAEAYPAGAILNRRIEITPTLPAGKMPFEASVERMPVPVAVAAPSAEHYDGWMKGLCFKVDAIAVRQILNSDVMESFEDVMIESGAGEETFHYTVGFFRSYEQVAAIRRSLVQQGFADAMVGAYVDGWRIDKAQAVSLLKKYPELANFVKQ